MKYTYPVIFTELKDGEYMAFVPDMEINTQGNNLAEAIEMVQDAIGIMGIDMEDEHKPIPTPSDLNQIKLDAGGIISMVDVDFAAYRRANDKRRVRK